jgi:hypothetical protein
MSPRKQLVVEISVSSLTRALLMSQSYAYEDSDPAWDGEIEDHTYGPVKLDHNRGTLCCHLCHG